jgi:hypothetical protein
MKAREAMPLQSKSGTYAGELVGAGAVEHDFFCADNGQQRVHVLVRYQHCAGDASRQPL